jgi:hypothetical protein
MTRRHTPAMSDKPAYLVFDIETVADGRLIQRVRYPELKELTPEQAVAKQRADLLEKSGGKSDFIPHTFQLPVSIAIAKVAADFSLIEVTTIDRPRFRPQIIARNFWKGWQAYGQPTLVTFNGRFFDIPVLELCAYRYGIPLPSWFNAQGNSYNQLQPAAQPLQYRRPPRPPGLHRQSGRDAGARRAQPLRPAAGETRQDGHQGQHGAGPVGTR